MVIIGYMALLLKWFIFTDPAIGHISGIFCTTTTTQQTTVHPGPGRPEILSYN